MKIGKLLGGRSSGVLKKIDPRKHRAFDAARYLRHYPDVASSGMDALEHYLIYGEREGREYFKKDVVGRRFDLDAVKIMQSGYFDEAWYRDTYGATREIGESAALHFLKTGVWEGLDPGPSFSTFWYWEQYPDILGVNPLLHFIDHGKAEGRRPSPPRGVLDAARATFQSVGDLDPLLYGTEQFYRLESLFVAEARVQGREQKDRLHAILREIPHTATHFFFVPWCIHSGADVVASNLVRAAAEKFGLEAVIVLVLDFDRLEGRDWLPDGLKIINVAKITAGTSYEERLKIVEMILQTARPQKTININSGILWKILSERGKILQKYTDLYTCIFCSDYNKRGKAVGYADRYIRDTIGFFKVVYLDNKAFKAELIAKHSFMGTDARRLVPLKIPVRIAPPVTIGTAEHPDGLRIFWASRIAPQKNYALLAEIIRNCPRTYSFSIWGHGSLDDVTKLQGMVKGLENVQLYGAYESFDALPLDRYDVFLYTSRCDGIPNVVLEAAACGFPVVASNVGGLREVIAPSRGWLVEDHENADAYVEALANIACDKIAAQRRGEKLAAYVRDAHAWKNFNDTLAGRGGLLDSQT
ncbi:MAG: glycosyltransferase family 4 protein [Flavobacteriaceae bacterium]